MGSLVQLWCLGVESVISPGIHLTNQADVVHAGPPWCPGGESGISPGTSWIEVENRGGAGRLEGVGHPKDLGKIIENTNLVNLMIRAFTLADRLRRAKLRSLVELQTP